MPCGSFITQCKKSARALSRGGWTYFHLSTLALPFKGCWNGQGRATCSLSCRPLSFYPGMTCLISAPGQCCWSPQSKANTTNNHFFRVLGMQGLTVEANVVVCEDDRSVPLGCAPHGDMNHSESCLNVMFLRREKKEPQCYVCCLCYREP